MNKNIKIIIIYSIISLILLYITENIFHPTYVIQMLQKILFFIIIPIILSKYLNYKVGCFWKIQKSSFLYGILFWLLWVLVIWITYYFLRNIIDWSVITESLTNRWINQTTFIFIFAYIMFWNSLVEEYFFRWIIFNSLLDYSKKIAYFSSSILFAIYHITIFWTWFYGYILLLALFWLFLWALFFAWLYEKTKWIWWAWFFHIIADFIILIIWYIEIFW